MSRFFSLGAAALLPAVFCIALSERPCGAQSAESEKPANDAEVFVTKLYPLDDLLNGGSAADVVEAITRLIEPKTWNLAGGSGAIAAVPAQNPAALSVTHNGQTHAQIADLLQRLRRVAVARKAGADTHFGLSPAEQKIEKALQSPTVFELFETPLDEVVDLVKRNHKIEMQIDKEALDDVGIATDTLVTKSLKHLSLRSALNVTLHEMDLTYVAKDAVLRITTPEAAAKMRSVRLYDVDELVLSRDTPAGKELVAEPLADMLRTVAVPSVDDPRANGTLAVIPRGLPRALAVSGTIEFHEQVADVLDQLRRAAKKTSRVNAAEKKILDALKSPTELELFETPLEEVVNLVKENHKIEIQIDRRALDDVGIATDTLVTKSLKGISLRSALRLILRELDLTYMIKDEVLLITSPDTLEEQVLVKTCPIDDLLAPAKAGQPGLDAKALAEVVVKAVAPRTWGNKEVGAIVPYALPDANVLVVRQSYAAHEDIAALLGALQRAGGKKVAPPKLKPGQKLFDPDEAERKIVTALKNPTEFELDETPLDEMIDLLRENYEIEILLDKAALDDVGIATDTLVTAKLKGITLRAALQKVLGDEKLTYVIADEVLQITTPEIAGKRFYTAVYPVDAAVEAKLTAGMADGPDDKLVRKIVASIAPKSWQRADGAAAIAVLAPGGKRVLIVRQTYPVHEQLADLLGVLGIRDEDRSVVFRPPPEPPPAPPRVPIPAEGDDIFG